MRAQLRTYHSIPSLQAHQDPNAYKQLQDAPRLKSILKGATEDTEQPSTVEDIKRHPVPRTNPVNLIFVLSQYAPKISELHFFPPRDFFDLVMRPNLSSRSRATAFLWLMWWYLESNFTKEDALNNPYGPGQYGPPDDPATADMPIKCPPFEFLTPEMEALENVDTPDELNFGEIKRKERQAILENDMSPVVTGPKRSNKKGRCPIVFRSYASALAGSHFSQTRLV
jgi:Ino eighty subunit 1